METRTWTAGKERKTSLETFLVEWKLASCSEKSLPHIALETFLVEWKPCRKLPHLPLHKCLETFLVEWKLRSCAFSAFFMFSLKPS